MFELNPEYTLNTLADDIATQKRLICYAMYAAMKTGNIDPETARTVARRLDRITEIVNDYIAEH